MTGTRNRKWCRLELARVAGVLLLGPSSFAQVDKDIPGTQFGVVPPVIESSIGEDVLVWAREELTFRVTATNPQGNPLTLTLLNPPVDSVFAPAFHESAPIRRDFHWYPPWGGPHHLVFEARDAGDPSIRSRMIVRVNAMGGYSRSNTLVGDVTGDGVMDVVAGAQFGTVDGVSEAGFILVFRGRTTPQGTPTATLTVPGAVMDDHLTSAVDTAFGASDQGLFLEDVTGDGVLDIVAAAALADVGGVLNAGAVYVWKGGPGLHGSQAPTACLVSPHPVAEDRLGESARFNDTGLVFDDVTGDGVRDLLVKSEFADILGTVDAGALYVWEGGSGLTGQPLPTATLTIPGAAPGDRLTGTCGQGVFTHDLNGDGTRDVLAIASFADQEAVSDGAIYYWTGGPALAGQPTPDATFSVPGASDSDFLGCSFADYGFLEVADVSGDGLDDLVVANTYADLGGVENVGAIHVFQGSVSWSGAQSPLASLSVSGASAEDYLVSQGDRSMFTVDVTGDGILDVVASASWADVSGVEDAGAVYVFAGGTGLFGDVAPAASLTIPGASVDDHLGLMQFTGHSVDFADLTGNGTLDIVAGTPWADVAGESNAGQFSLWHGGPGLSGTVAPDLSLAVTPNQDDRMGEVSGHGVRIADVTGDGQVDLLIGTSDCDEVALDSGAIFLWAGGAGLAGTGSVAPSAILSVMGGFAGDRLGSCGGGEGLRLADVSGDGVLDVIAAASHADVIPHANQGVVYVWRGGSGMAGSSPPDSTLMVAVADNQDQLSYRSSLLSGVALADFSGDGVLDVVVSSEEADLSTLIDCGSLYVWEGGSSMGLGVVHESHWLRRRPADRNHFDQITDVSYGPGFQFGDVSGDGLLEMVVGGTSIDVAGAFNAGAVLLFDPDRNLKFPVARLARQAPENFDELGL